MIKLKEDEYRKYIDIHIKNVEKIWKHVLKKYIRDEYWLEDGMIYCINMLIENHDRSKYLDDEFRGYRQYFYSDNDETISVSSFEYSWNHHIKNNSHHWEYWIIPKKENLILDMPFEYIIEMLCDWSAMAIQFKDSPSAWYNENKKSILVSDYTRKIIEDWIMLFDFAVKDVL
jgi:hypothetical protein